MLFPTMAYSAPIGSTLCTVTEWFTNGTVGVGLAALSIFIIGIAALMNKITWGMFLFGSLDVVLIFGAADMVLALGGNDCFAPY